MAEFSKLIVTDKGNTLIAKALANEAVIKFTKVASSDNSYEVSELEQLESLRDIRQTYLEPRVKRVNNVSVEVSSAFNNMELTEGYYIMAFGLYADDPDDGEILYGVAVETSGNCYMPAYNGITSSGIHLKFVTTVGNAHNVSLEVSPAAVATIGDIEGIREELTIVDFDDSGEVEGIESFTDFMSSFVKKTSIYQFLANMKTGFKYLLHMGRLVNNGQCETPGQFALDAAYGHTLTEWITQLYSDIADGITNVRWNEISNRIEVNYNGVWVNYPPNFVGDSLYLIRDGVCLVPFTNLNETITIATQSDNIFTVLLKDTGRGTYNVVRFDKTIIIGDNYEFCIEYRQSATTGSGNNYITAKYGSASISTTADSTFTTKVTNVTSMQGEVTFTYTNATSSNGTRTIEIRNLYFHKKGEQ